MADKPFARRDLPPKRRKRKLPTFTLFVVAVIAAGVYSFLRFAPLSVSGVTALEAVCGKGAPDPGARAVWSAGSLAVRVSETRSCGEKLESATAQQFGSIIFLRTHFARSADVATGCTCEHVSAVDIPDVPDYKYAIYQYSWP